MPDLVAALILVGIPTLVVFGVLYRIRTKEAGRDAFLDTLRDELREAGYEPLDAKTWRREGRVFKIEAGTNPLFSPFYTVRLAAYSDTVHDFDLQSGKPVDPEFASFTPLLERWDSAGKMFVECWAAGPRKTGSITGDLETLGRLAAEPMTKSCRGGTFTIRKGFEKDCPQWHWRADQVAKRPRDLHRWCISYRLEWTCGRDGTKRPGPVLCRASGCGSSLNAFSGLVRACGRSPVRTGYCQMTHESYSLDELARQLGRDRREVEKLVQRGRIPGRKVAGQWQFHPVEITQWPETQMRDYNEQEKTFMEEARKIAEEKEAEQAAKKATKKKYKRKLLRPGRRHPRPRKRPTRAPSPKSLNQRSPDPLPFPASRDAVLMDISIFGAGSVKSLW